MNKIDDLIKILEFCREYKRFILNVGDDTEMSTESFDDLGVDIILKDETKISIYNTVYEINGVEFRYENIDTVLNNIKSFCEKAIEINGIILSCSQLDDIYNHFLKYCNGTKRELSKKQFIKKIQEHKISIKVYKTFRDLLYYFYVDGQDSEQILDGIENIINYGFSIDNLKMIKQLDNGTYISIDY